MPWEPPIGLPTPDWPTVGNPIDAIPPVAPDSTPPGGWTGQVAGRYFVQPDDPSATDTDNPYGYPALPRETLPAEYNPGSDVVYCATWNFNLPHHYYVSDGGSNENQGYPGNSRYKLPKPIPAGAKVFVDGTCSWAQTAPHDIEAQGDEENVVWVTNYNPAVPATLTAPWAVTEGSAYFIGKGLVWDQSEWLYQTTIIVSSGPTYPTRYICFSGGSLLGKGSEEGTSSGSEENGGGYNIDNYGDWSTVAEQIVFHDLGAHKTGNWRYEGGDPTGTPFLINLFCRDCWIVDCEASYASGGGFGVGIGNGDEPDEECTLRCYLGRCTAHHIAQAPFWSKRSKDCIISQCVSYTSRRDDPSFGDGPGFGGQYGPINYWIIYCTGYDMQGGVHIMGGVTEVEGVRTNGDVYIVGNEFYNIHDTEGTAGPWDAEDWDTFPGVVIGVRGGANVHVVNNTIHDFDAGIKGKDVRPAQVIGNILTGRNTGVSGYDMQFQTDTGGDKKIQDNIIQENAGAIVVRNAGSTYTTVASLNAVGSNKAGNISAATADIYEDADNADFTLKAGSPAIDLVSTEPDVYAIFEAYFGRDIRRDHTGATRPQGDGWDAGPNESGGGGGESEPPVPRTRSLRRAASSFSL
jgi:hypothetical protein